MQNDPATELQLGDVPLDPFFTPSLGFGYNEGGKRPPCVSLADVAGSKDARRVDPTPVPERPAEGSGFPA